MTFVEEARAAKAQWKRTTDVLPEAARAAGMYRSLLREFCLPEQFAAANVLPDGRGALATFAAAQIPWHQGIGEGPTNHLCSSQVQCVNALAPFVHRPGALAAIFGSVLDIGVVVPFGDPVVPDHHVAFEWIGIHDVLGEWRQGVGTRGAHNTSADAAIPSRTSAGLEEGRSSSGVHRIAPSGRWHPAAHTSSRICFRSSVCQNVPRQP